MGFFNSTFSLFDSNKPHKDLINVYSKINDLASNIKKELDNLRKLQDLIVDIKSEKNFSNDRTGKLGVKKVEFISEELIPKLEEFS